VSAGMHKGGGVEHGHGHGQGLMYGCLCCSTRASRNSNCLTVGWAASRAE